MLTAFFVAFATVGIIAGTVGLLALLGLMVRITWTEWEERRRRSSGNQAYEEIVDMLSKRSR